MRVWLVVAVLVVGPARVRAQDTAATRRIPPSACCNVARIDLKTGVVTARETASGYTFQFKLADRKLLASLKIGQKIWANFETKRVAIKAGHDCCDILPSVPGSPAPALNPTPGA